MELNTIIKKILKKLFPETIKEIELQALETETLIIKSGQMVLVNANLAYLKKHTEFITKSYSKGIIIQLPKF